MSIEHLVKYALLLFTQTVVECHAQSITWCSATKIFILWHSLHQHSISEILGTLSVPIDNPIDSNVDITRETCIHFWRGRQFNHQLSGQTNTSSSDEHMRANSGIRGQPRRLTQLDQDQDAAIICECIVASRTARKSCSVSHGTKQIAGK